MIRPTVQPKAVGLELFGHGSMAAQMFGLHNDVGFDGPLECIGSIDFGLPTKQDVTVAVGAACLASFFLNGYNAIDA